MLLLLSLFASLPLGWMRIGSGIVGTIGYFHVFALALIGATQISRQGRRDAIAIVRSLPVIWLLVAALLLVTMVSFLHVEAPFTVADLIRQGFYVTAAICAGAVILHVYASGAERHLVWVAPLALVVFIVGMNFSLGGAFWPVLQGALAQGDPNVVILRVFRGAFAGVAESAEDVQSNWRHDIVFSLLLAGVISILGAYHSRGINRLIGVLSALLVGLIVIFSMSRANWLSLSIMGLIVITGLVPRSRLSIFAAPIAAPLLTAAAIYLFAFTSVPWLLIGRLTDVSSYEGRFDAATYRLDAMNGEAFITGLPFRAPWAHHMFIDYFTATGIVGGLIAALLIASCILRMAKLTLSAAKTKDVFIRLDMILAACLISMPLTRFISAPKGHPFLAQWVALGIAGALIVLARQAASKPQISTVAKPKPLAKQS